MASPPNNRRRLPGPGATVALVLAAAILIAAVAVVATGIFSSGDSSGTKGANRTIRKQIAAARAARAKHAGPDRDHIAVVVKSTALRAAPGGRRIGRLSAKTEFKSTRVVAVVGRRGDWLRVITSELPNGKRGWIDARDTDGGVTAYRVRADLSARRIEIVRDGRVVRRIRSAVGEKGTPTPTGRFAITDKVPFTDRGSPYGCCALALSAHQPNTPSEWSGGDRIAIHATPATTSIGRPVTLGCMRVPAADARWLMRHIPLGTQVSIRA
jgi:lipoprotein-anchoring transpeptidase ErfK/SrfK